eukprot:scaffold1856_cov96-Amphora_coffeaeformis.AAC.2
MSVSVVGSGGSGGGVKSCSGAGLSAESVARAGSWSSKKKWLYESQPRGRLSWMGSSGTCMLRSRWSGPLDGSQAQSEGGRSSRSPPWNSWGVESGSLEMCLARYLPMAVVPVMTKGPRTR